MIIKLNNINIHLNLENEIPYFQVAEPHKLRLDVNSVETKDMKYVMNRIFREKPIHCSLLSKHIKPVKYKEKTNIGRYITIHH
ncbi:hypothetical protein GZH82_09485 [Staphylococcus ursi]|uniref:hypothetical protein n=1 Tax=Staphylococcus sp. MI 10-1553 TaxID=1912064 RepID=UPI0013983499|nr:hypothetical protein [Staphylococcus sp. MI 10-1553]QHW37551.1 hypothetical protein GZH82_09485 [Staphylococcus sp. MI 10-1553]